jgi:hypothetical protein
VLAAGRLAHVGRLLGLARRRLARSTQDWHPCLDLCARWRPLVAEADGRDEPPDDHERLRWGRRGLRSDAALYLRKSRMFAGLRHTARRGARLKHPPRGDVRGPDGAYQGEPAAQAPRVRRLICAVFEPQGRRHGVLRYLVTQEIRLPMRPQGGATRGPLDGRRPPRMTRHTLRHHPIAAGADRWGYRTLDRRQPQPGRRSSGRTVKAPDDCEVLRNDRFPASSSGARCDALPHRVANNRATAAALGAPREGPALFGGLGGCGRCGRRWLPAYRGRAHRLRYRCSRGGSAEGAPRCRSRSGAFRDRFVVAPRLPGLPPPAGALRLAAEHARRTARAPREAPGPPRLERSPDEAARAARQSAAVAPETRLVARALARRGEEA